MGTKKRLAMKISNDRVTDLTPRFCFSEIEKDFYLENGDVIMTEQYHVKRGSCCGSGCRHCPFSPPHQFMNNKLREDIETYKDKE